VVYSLVVLDGVETSPCWLFLAMVSVHDVGSFILADVSDDIV
jgi:hypothetical protein